MKKTILLISLIGLFISSCNLQEPEEPYRTAKNLESVTRILASYSIVAPAMHINNCMLASEFLNSSEEQRKEPIFSTISYNSETNTLIVAEMDTIKTYGKDLFTVGTEWSLNSWNWNQSVIKCIGENQWTVSFHYGSDYREIDAIPTFTLAGRTADGLWNWKCKCSGKVKENDSYSATFQTDKDFDIKWNSWFYGTSYSSFQEISGVFSAIFSIDGKETDRCTLTYEDDEVKITVTSLD